MKKITKRAVTASAPKRIWLHSEHPEAPPPNNVYWFENEWLDYPEDDVRDVEYVRADLVRRALIATRHDAPALRALAKSLGMTPNAGAKAPPAERSD